MDYETMTEYMGYKIGDQIVMRVFIGDTRKPVRGSVTGFAGPADITSTASSGQVVMEDEGGTRRCEPPLFTRHA